jgi:hypothetical protein
MGIFRNQKKIAPEAEKSQLTEDEVLMHIIQYSLLHTQKTGWWFSKKVKLNEKKIMQDSIPQVEVINPLKPTN